MGGRTSTTIAKKTSELETLNDFKEAFNELSEKGMRLRQRLHATGEITRAVKLRGFLKKTAGLFNYQLKRVR